MVEDAERRALFGGTAEKNVALGSVRSVGVGGEQFHAAHCPRLGEHLNVPVLVVTIEVCGRIRGSGSADQR